MRRQVERIQAIFRISSGEKHLAHRALVNVGVPVFDKYGPAFDHLPHAIASGAAVGLVEGNHTGKANFRGIHAVEAYPNDAVGFCGKGNFVTVAVVYGFYGGGLERLGIQAQGEVQQGKEGK